MVRVEDLEERIKNIENTLNSILGLVNKEIERKMEIEDRNLTGILKIETNLLMRNFKKELQQHIKKLEAKRKLKTTEDLMEKIEDIEKEIKLLGTRMSHFEKMFSIRREKE